MTLAGAGLVKDLDYLPAGSHWLMLGLPTLKKELTTGPLPFLLTESWSYIKNICMLGEIYKCYEVCRLKHHP